MDKQLCANVQSLATKQPFLSQNETQSKRKRRKFLIALDFLYKVSIVYCTAFQSLFSEIIRIWELFFRSAGSSFSYKHLFLQWKTALSLSRNWFLLTILYILSVYMVGRAGFSLAHGNKRILNSNLVLILHIFQKSENKIIKWNLIPCNGNQLSI